MTILSDFLSSLEFTCVQSPFPDKYPSPFHVPGDVPYSELDETAITFVQYLPSEILEFVGQEIRGRHLYNSEFESFTNYLIEPVFDDSGMFLIEQYTFYQ